MSRIIVIGGGLIGLATALMIAKQGHDVTVLERDPEPLPATPQEAWDSWERPGVPQFRQGHYLGPRGRQVLDEHLPEVIKALLDAGAARTSLLDVMPPAITDKSARPGDEKFATITARRPVLEFAIASVARQRVDIRRGIRVTGLLSDGHRSVTGVTANGAALAADLVIDASGHRSPLAGWLKGIGADPPPEESSEASLVTYGRYFRPAAGRSVPPFRAAPVTRFDAYALGAFLCDSGTWLVFVALYAHDQALKSLREEANWTRLLRACPLHENLVTDGEPVGEFLAFANRAERLQVLVTDGMPTATGIVAVGDSWGTTSPIFGRGITLGLMHAAVTAEAVADHLSDPLALALAHDSLSRQRVLPYLRSLWQQHVQTRDQFAAAMGGRPAASPAMDPAAAAMRDLTVAMTADPDIFRAYLEIAGGLATAPEVLGRPGLVARARELAEGQSIPPPPGPARAALLTMLS